MILQYIYIDKYIYILAIYLSIPIYTHVYVCVYLIHYK